MIKIINCTNKNYLKKLQFFLELRRSQKNNELKKVSKIIKDIKKNGVKALLKYERKYSKNNNITSSKKEINKAIKMLNPKVKKAIDFSYNKILNFHKKQLKNFKNISYIDILKNKFCFFKRFIS